MITGLCFNQYLGLDCSLAKSFPTHNSSSSNNSIGGMPPKGWSPRKRQAVIAKGLLTKQAKKEQNKRVATIESSGAALTTTAKLKEIAWISEQLGSCSNDTIFILGSLLRSNTLERMLKQKQQAAGALKGQRKHKWTKLKQCTLRFFLKVLTETTGMEREVCEHWLENNSVTALTMVCFACNANPEYEFPLDEVPSLVYVGCLHQYIAARMAAMGKFWLTEVSSSWLLLVQPQHD